MNKMSLVLPYWKPRKRYHHAMLYYKPRKADFWWNKIVIPICMQHLIGGVIAMWMRFYYCCYYCCAASLLLYCYCCCAVAVVCCYVVAAMLMLLIRSCCCAAAADNCCYYALLLMNYWANSEKGYEGMRGGEGAWNVSDI